MTRILVLDAGPLSLLSAPRKKSTTEKCWNWLESHIAAGVEIVVPEIADHEVRRELIRAGKSKSIRALDEFSGIAEYIPITTTAMRLAADFWAQIRRLGLPTADRSIDADCIRAQVAAMSDFVVATTNVRHIARLVPAATWDAIKPTENGL